MPDFSIGVDLGGTNLRIAAVSTEGDLLEKVTLASKAAPTRDQVIDQMCSAIQGLSAKYKATGNLLGVGIGVPGLIDMPTGTIRKSVNLTGWENFPVRAEIERRLNARVVLDNDARVAALGEQWQGAGRGVSNMAMITLGTGIGGAIVLGGKIWYGMNGMAGEFGHVTLEPEGVPCGCGNRGCAEQYASASAIMRMARELIARGEAPSLAAASSEPHFGAHSIYDFAMQGDKPARRIFQTFGRFLGLMLAGAVNILNLDMYVIGGGVASAWDAFAPNMFEELRQRSVVYAATAPDTGSRGEQAAIKNVWEQPPSDVQATIITRALLGGDAGLYGAARAGSLFA
jgi:glucokinase